MWTNMTSFSCRYIVEKYFTHFNCLDFWYFVLFLVCTYFPGNRTLPVGKDTKSVRLKAAVLEHVLLKVGFLNWLLVLKCFSQRLYSQFYSISFVFLITLHQSYCLSFPFSAVYFTENICLLKLYYNVSNYHTEHSI